MTGSKAISFSMIQCSGCGAARVRGIPCPDCGKKCDPREVDYSTIDRLRTAGAYFTRLNEIPQSAGERFDSFEDLLTAAVSAVDSCCREVLQECQDGPSHASPSHQALGFRKVLDDVIATERDYLGSRFGRAASEAKEWMLATMDLFQSTITCRDMGETQKLANKFAVAYEKPLAMAQAYHSDELAAAAIDLTDPRSMAESTVSLVLDRTKVPLVTLCEYADRRLSETLDIPRTRCLGLEFEVYRTLSDVLLDGNFTSRFEEAYRIFDSGKISVSDLVYTDSLFLDDLEESQVDLESTLRSLLLVSQGAWTERQLLDQVLAAYVSMFEGAGALAIRALLRASGLRGSKYEKLRIEDATDQLRKANLNTSLSRCLDGLDEEIRIAKSHGGVRYERDKIALKTRKVDRTLSPLELVSLTLRAMQSIQAVIVALRQWLFAQGVELNDDRLLLESGFDRCHVGAILCSQLYGVRADVNRVDDLLHVDVYDLGSVGVVWGVVVGMMSTCKAGQILRFEAVDYSAVPPRQIAGGALGLLTFASDIYDFDRISVAFATASSVSVDGVSWVDSDVRRGILMRWGIQTMQDLADGSIGGIGALKRLASLRRFAKDWGDESSREILATLTERVSQWWQVSGGHAAPPSMGADLGPLMAEGLDERAMTLP